MYACLCISNRVYGCWWRWSGGRGRVDECRRGDDAGVCMHVCVLAIGCMDAGGDGVGGGGGLMSVGEGGMLVCVCMFVY